MYRLHIPSNAQKAIKKLSEIHKESILEGLQEIKEEPLVGKPLSRDLTGRFSYRIGVYRIVYKINQKDNVISILTVGHRSHVYEK